jgi:hypothetical protein
MIIASAFNQVYGKNWEQKTEHKDLKNLQCRVGAKEGMVSEEISNVKKKPSTGRGGVLL